MPVSPRRLAPLSLAAATAVFLATLPFRDVFAVALVHAFAEAAMIGGLADWFAVVALFRHPMGIPIPHTAILPAHRARLQKGIIDIVQNTWLNQSAIRARIESWDVGRAVAGWLAAPRARAALEHALRALLRELLRTIDADRLGGALRAVLRERIAPADLARWIRRAGEALITSRAHDPFVASAVDQARALLASASLQMNIARMLRDAADAYATSPMKRLGRWLAENAGALDYTDLARALTGALDADLAAVREDAAHPLRRELDERLRALLASEAMLKAGDLLDTDTLPALLADAIAQARTWLEEDTEREDSVIIAQAASLLEEARLRLERDAEARAAVDRWVKERILHLVEDHHGEIGSLVEENLSRLDDAQLVAQIESKVGNDLQYIRINGAVVGGLVGAFLFLLTALIG